MPESITVSVITETAKFLSRWFRSTIIEGRVINSKDEPLAGVVVYLGDTEEVKTSIDGGFVFEVSKPGIKKLSIKHGKKMIDNVKQFHIAKGDKASITVKIPTAKDVEPIVVSGELVDLNNKPLSGIHVELDGVRDITSHDGGFILEIENPGIFQLNLTFEENEQKNVKKVHLSRRRENVSFKLQVDFDDLFPREDVDPPPNQVALIEQKTDIGNENSEDLQINVSSETSPLPISQKKKNNGNQSSSRTHSSKQSIKADTTNNKTEQESKTQRRIRRNDLIRNEYREGWKRQIRKHQDDLFRCPECNSDVRGSNFLRHWDKHEELTTKSLPKKLSRVIPRINDDKDSSIMDLCWFSGKDTFRVSL